jgi:hypothetical protein
MATSFTLQNDAILDRGYLKVNGITAATITESGITSNVTGNVTGNLIGNVTGNLTGSLTTGGSLTRATVKTASGTAVDFTGIPSWVKRITVILNGVSTNGTSAVQIQLGNSGGVESTGYSNANGGITGTNTCSLLGYTTGIIVAGLLATHIRYATISMININLNNWIISGSGVEDIGNTTTRINGSKSLTSTLDRVRITTINETDTFDAGTINIAYEG